MKNFRISIIAALSLLFFTGQQSPSFAESAEPAKPTEAAKPAPGPTDPEYYPGGDPLAVEIPRARPSPNMPGDEFYRQGADHYAGAAFMPVNKEEAAKLYRKAAEMGHPRAAAALGSVEEEKQNISEAYFWYSVSIKLYRAMNDRGYALSVDDARLPVFRALTDEQRAELDKRVEEWKPVTPK